MLAADWETLSISLPSITISSFWFVDSLAVTPSSMGMFRTICSSKEGKYQDGLVRVVDGKVE